MAKPRTPRLKVFQAQLGFVESVVAVPSKAAALKAWGTHQDLFATGDAKIAADEAAVSTALAHPGTPLQRAVGTRDPFRVETRERPRVPGIASKAPKPKADRSELDRAEAELHRLDEAREGEEAELRQAQAELRARAAAARKSYAAARKAAVAAVSKARARYRDTEKKD